MNEKMMNICMVKMVTKYARHLREYNTRSINSPQRVRFFFFFLTVFSFSMHH